MKHVIIGTAGHVDHGKTVLVKALTGTDTDRLAEEKCRGITIEPGFARLDWPDGTQAGIVDVPGHEKFIKNMLAGAGGIDLAMLVIAADEGVMPQTREHLEICSLLGRCAGRVIVCGGTITEDEKVKNFEPRILPSVMLFNSAVDYIKKCSLPPEKTSVAVMDFNGFQKDKLSLLVPLASNLKVITGNPEEFSPVRRRLYDDWGLAMTVTENVNEAGGCTFVIAPRTDKSNPDGGCLLYRNEYSGSTVCLSGSGVTLPDDITKVLPPCNSLLFASALYELCGATRLSELCFDRLADISSKGRIE